MKHILISAALLATSVHAENITLNLDTKNITLSGLSSGGYMANQFHLAYSSWVNGVGIMAAGPFYCAQNDIAVALAQCVNKSEPAIDLATLNKVIKSYEDKALIEPLSNLKTSKVWLFRGELDNRIAEPVTQALYQQYAQWVDSSNLTFVQDKPIAHVFPTKDYGVDCKEAASPFIGNCGYDAAGEMLQAIYGPLNSPSPSESGKVIAIDQHKLGGEAAQSLAEEGYLYVPDACQGSQSCQIHVSFHGCNQNAEAVGQEFVLNNGLNPWANSNRLVILYPQTKSSMFMPLNPQGCWDWWGYTDEHYATVKGQQIQAVRNMVINLNSSMEAINNDE